MDRRRLAPTTATTALPAYSVGVTLHGAEVAGGRSPVRRLLGGGDPAGLLYGAIVSATALAAVSLSTSEAVRVAVATGAVLVIYWMADLYVHALAMRFDGDSRGLLRRLGSSATRKSGVLMGGLPSIAVYVGVYAVTRNPTVAAFSALVCAIGILTIAGYLGARHAGDPRGAAMLEASGAGMLGVVVLFAKSLLH